MRLRDLDNDFLMDVLSGLREYNRNSPPIGIVFRASQQAPPTAGQQAEADQRMVEAIKHGLIRAMTERGMI
jgi:hypothetical protein